VDLAEDLRRFLDGQPIRARAVGAAERSWRWCRRNPAVAALTAGLILALGLGLAGVLWEWREAGRRAAAEAAQRQRAEQAEGEALAAAGAERAANEEVQKRLRQVEKGVAVLASVFRDVDPRSEEKEGKPLRMLLGDRLGEAVKHLE